jgi:hypothetical protein
MDRCFWADGASELHLQHFGNSIGYVLMNMLYPAVTGTGSDHPNPGTAPMQFSVADGIRRALQPARNKQGSALAPGGALLSFAFRPQRARSVVKPVGKGSATGLRAVMVKLG